MGKYPPIKSLYPGALSATSEDFDWGGPDGNYEDFTEGRLRVHVADRCSQCGEIVHDLGDREDVQHSEIASDWPRRNPDDYDDDEEEDDGEEDPGIHCDGYLSGGVPMMNYRYPLPCRPSNLREAQEALIDLPLTIVEDTENDNWFLALTGGGMNLTWEICEAFMRLGYLPPTYYAADLPEMAGRGESRRDRWIMAGCRAALRQHVKFLQRDLKRFDEKLRTMRLRQAARKIYDERKAAAEAAYDSFHFERQVVEADAYWDHHDPTDRWHKKVYFAKPFSEEWKKGDSAWFYVYFASELSTEVVKTEVVEATW